MRYIICLCLSFVLAISASANRAIIVLGPPGSGKGTQCALLKQQLNLPVLSFGAFFRDERAAGSELSSQYDAIREDRTLKAHFKTNVFRQKLNAGSFVDGLIIDSWLKEELPFAALSDMYFKNQTPIVIELVVPKDILIARGCARVICPKNDCGLSFAAPDLKSASCCPSCSTPLFKRARDNPADFPERVARFFARREAIHQVYQDRDIKIHQIDANRPPKEVNDDIMRIIEVTEEF